MQRKLFSRENNEYVAFSPKILPKIIFHKKETSGIRAVVSALMRMLHPSAAIRDCSQTLTMVTSFQDHLVICWKMRKVNNHQQITVGMQHNNSKGLELYCVEHSVQTKSEWRCCWAQIGRKHKRNDFRGYCLFSWGRSSKSHRFLPPMMIMNLEYSTGRLASSSTRQRGVQQYMW